MFHSKTEVVLMVAHFHWTTVATRLIYSTAEHRHED